MSHESILRTLEVTEEFKKVYDILEKSQKNAFITGRAGTGKSTLLEYFRDHTKKRVVVLAPTGVAAVNVKGQTIHSFFQFKPDVTPDSVLNIPLARYKRNLYKNIDTLIIDEISMVRADLLDCIDAFLQRYGPYEGFPFGGVQLVMIGDLYQLPPVVTKYEESIFSSHYKSPFFFDSKAFQKIKLETIELEKVYRQKDEDFIEILNAIREKKVTNAHLELLNSRHQPDFIPPEDDFFIYLTTTNALADQINHNCLKKISTDTVAFKGEMTGQFEGRSLPTNEMLSLKVGAQIMLLNNDPSDRWVNGTIGKVVAIPGIDEPISVELSGGTIVEVSPFTWEMYKFAFNEDSQTIESQMVGSFRQYPIRLAWAVTIHKAQGKTFSKVIVDIGQGAFAHGQVYVALSRCTHLEGLVLKKPIHPRFILLDPHVQSFFETTKTSLS